MIRRILNRILNCCKYVYYRLILYRFCSKDLPEDHVLVKWNQPSAQSRHRTVAIFAHYDSEAIIHEYVRYYITSLNDAGVDVVFVSSSDGLELADCEAIQPLCRKIIIRKNIGYDFGSWKVGLENADVDSYENLILCNDSAFGPLFDLHEILEEMKLMSCDAWSMTNSHQVWRHMQSYFMFFRSAVFKSDVFRDFWESYRYYENKEYFIWNGELQLSRQLRRADFTLGAYCDYLDIKILPTVENVWFIVNGRLTLNPTHFFWKSILVNNRVPFVKKELLRDNPVGMRGLDFLETFIRNQTNYEYGMIEDVLINHDK